MAHFLTCEIIIACLVNTGMREKERQTQVEEKAVAEGKTVRACEGFWSQEVKAGEWKCVPKKGPGILGPFLAKKELLPNPQIRKTIRSSISDLWLRINSGMSKVESSQGLSRESGSSMQRWTSNPLPACVVISPVVGGALGCSYNQFFEFKNLHRVANYPFVFSFSLIFLVSGATPY